MLLYQTNSSGWQQLHWSSPFSTLGLAEEVVCLGTLTSIFSSKGFNGGYSNKHCCFSLHVSSLSQWLSNSVTEPFCSSQCVSTESILNHGSTIVTAAVSVSVENLHGLSVVIPVIHTLLLHTFLLQVYFSCNCTLQSCGLNRALKQKICREN